MTTTLLSLKEALKTDRLEEFVRQEESRGVAGAQLAELEETLAAAIKQPQSKDQTSRSPSSDGSTGK